MGLDVSLHGIILTAGRAIFEFCRIKYIPQLPGKVNSIFKMPAHTLIVVFMNIGYVALITGKTGENITFACFAEFTFYVLLMDTVLVLQKRAPKMVRSFRVPWYPIFPGIALLIATISLIAITILNGKLALIYSGLPALAYIWLHFIVKKSPHGNPVNI
jgi:ethanolamine permease